MLCFTLVILKSAAAIIILNFTTKKQKKPHSKVAMSLDNIQLTPFLIQELYKNSLVELYETEPKKKTKPVVPFNVLGNNKKKVIIIVENDETLYLPDD